jgi:hypothetical protein
MLFCYPIKYYDKCTYNNQRKSCTRLVRKVLASLKKIKINALITMLENQS